MAQLHDVSWKRLAPYAYGYMLLPVILFCLFWLRPQVGIPLALLAAISLVLACGPKFLDGFPKLKALSACDGRMLGNPILRSGPNDEPRESLLSGKLLLLMLAVAFAWCFFGGQGGLWYQASDWSARNAVFYDLITRPWPVYYNDGSAALVYYIGYWLPSASLAHGLFMATGDSVLCFKVGNILLLIWSAGGIYLVELLIAAILQAASRKQILLIVALLVFFSGMDVIGVALLTIQQHQMPASLWMGWKHIDPWALWYQYSSNTTMLFWVFNQTIITWICTCALLLSRNVSNFVVIVGACFASGPFGSVGLAIIAIILGIQALAYSLRQGRVGAWVRSVFSLQNIAVILPVIAFAAYYLCTAATGGGSGQAFSGGILANVALYLLFVALEAGIYLIIVGFDYRRSALFWGIAVSLLVIPLIQVGTNGDFCMRASIPALFVLMLMCGRFIMEHGKGKDKLDRRRFGAATLLTICLVLGAATPLDEFVRGFYFVARQGVEASVQPFDDIEGGALGGDQTKNVKSAVDAEKMYFRWLAGS